MRTVVFRLLFVRGIHYRFTIGYVSSVYCLLSYANFGLNRGILYNPKNVDRMKNYCTRKLGNRPGRVRVLPDRRVYGTARHSTVLLYLIVPYCAILCLYYCQLSWPLVLINVNTVPTIHSTLQYCTVPYGTVTLISYGTVRYGTVPCSRSERTINTKPI